LTSKKGILINQLNCKKVAAFLGITLLIIISAPGCRLGYILHAAVGQARILYGAVPMEEGLKNPSLDPAHKDRLRLVAPIKSFGETVLGLKETENYQTVYLKSRKAPVYLISACPRDSLNRKTWWFPVVGRMPYLGFFDLESAGAEKERLLEKDLDVYLTRAEAYSTLGWFRDPVTMNLVEGSVPDLVETILHEMTHTTLYVKGQGEFNEGLAMLVGKMGARLFLETTYGPDHPFTREARESIGDERIFSAFMDTLLRRLERLYNGPASYGEKLAQREEVFSGALSAFGRLKPGLRTDRYRGFGTGPLNNAYLAIIGLYHRHFGPFEALLRENGNSIPNTISYLQALAREGGDMLEKMGRRNRPQARQGAWGQKTGVRIRAGGNRSKTHINPLQATFSP
jgi:predicted aminopeptidase